MSESSRGVLVDLAVPADPTVDLVLFPCAGGGPSMFARWPEHLPPSWRVRAVCLPGRDHRFAEPWPTTLSAVVEEVVTALAEEQTHPQRVFVGHSMGSVVALATAARVTPQSLVVVATAPPSDGWTGYATLSDRQLQAEMETMVRAEVQALAQPGLELGADLVAELVQLTGEALLADLTLLETFVLPSQPLPCSIHAFYGTYDQVPPRPWSRETLGTATVTMVEGDHFFPRVPPPTFMQHLVSRLGPVVAP